MNVLLVNELSHPDEGAIVFFFGETSEREVENVCAGN